MDLVFGYLAGLLTLVNPCVLPVLPIVLASAVQAHRLGPVALAAGMSLTFVALGLTVAVAGHALGLTERDIAIGGAILMMGFGVVLLVPRMNASFATATAGMAAQADAGIDRIDRSHLGNQVLGGALLGAVWSPCVGPTLGGAISLASSGGSIAWAGAIMAAFAAGVASVMLSLAYGARAAILRRKSAMQRVAERSKPILGIVFLAVGLMILTGFNHVVEAWLVNITPFWLQDFSVSL